MSSPGAATASAPRVSICMPAYNYAPFVAQALRSACAQTYAPLDIVVCDNGSTDATGAICAEFAQHDRRIDFFRQPHGSGVTAHNAVLQRAQGDYVCILHADDHIHRDKTARQVAFMQAQPQVGALFTHVYCSNAQDERLENLEKTFNQALTPAELAQKLLVGNMLCMSSVMLRRKTLAQVGWLHDTFQFMSDYEYWLRFLAVSEIALLPEPLTNYRLHGRNDSVRDLVTMKREGWRVAHAWLPKVLAARPDIAVPPGFVPKTLAGGTLYAGEWAMAQKFLQQKLREAPLTHHDAFQMLYSLNRQGQHQASKVMLEHLLSGQLRARS